MDGEGLLPLQIGAADAAHHALAQHQPVVLYWSQHRHSGAELSRCSRTGELEVQSADLYAAHTVYGLIIAHDGDTQQHGGLPGIRQLRPCRPEIPLGWAADGPIHQFGVSRQSSDVKLQVPAVVKLQPLLPGNIGDPPKVGYRRIYRADGVEAEIAKVEAAAGVAGDVCICVGGGINDHIGSAAVHCLERGVHIGI